MVLETRQGKALPTDLRTAQTGGFLWMHVWLSSTRWRWSGLLRVSGHQTPVVDVLATGLHVPGDRRGPADAQGIVHTGLQKAALDVALSLQVNGAAAQGISGGWGRQPPFNRLIRHQRNRMSASPLCLRAAY